MQFPAFLFFIFFFFKQKTAYELLRSLVGSDGVLRGAPGGHPDTAAGSKVCVIVTPLVRGRMATVCEDVVTVTTPGDCVDVLVTDYGIAVNPLRPDLVKCLDDAGIPHVSIESLKEKAYSIVGRPDAVQFEDKVVAVLEARCISTSPLWPRRRATAWATAAASAARATAARWATP